MVNGDLTWLSLDRPHVSSFCGDVTVFPVFLGSFLIWEILNTQNCNFNFIRVRCAGMKFVILTCSLVSGNPLLRLSLETERLNIKHKGFLAVFGDPLSLVQPTLHIQPLFSAPPCVPEVPLPFFPHRRQIKERRKSIIDQDCVAPFTHSLLFGPLGSFVY